MAKNILQNMTYSEKLKDPRWQKKRLKILERDNFECINCNDKNKTLHVNHLYYLKEKKPWEYPDGILFTLCEDCHTNFTFYGNTNIESFFESLFKVGFCLPDLIELSIFIYEIKSLMEKENVNNKAYVEILNLITENIKKIQLRKYLEKNYPKKYVKKLINA